MLSESVAIKKSCEALKKKYYGDNASESVGAKRQNQVAVRLEIKQKNSLLQGTNAETIQLYNTFSVKESKSQILHVNEDGRRDWKIYNQLNSDADVHMILQKTKNSSPSS